MADNTPKVNAPRNASRATQPNPQVGNRRGAGSNASPNENTLEFGESMSVEAFKTLQGSKQLKIMTNPATGKAFFSCGGVTGAVSQRASLEEIAENPIISNVHSPETNEDFFLLHVDGGLEADMIL